jgi:hypothetical protein
LEEYLDMDLSGVQAAIEVSGMPPEVVKEIWKSAEADDYIKKALEAVKNDDR